MIYINRETLITTLEINEIEDPEHANEYRRFIDSLYTEHSAQIGLTEERYISIVERIWE